MNKMSKICVSLLTIITVTVIVSVMSGCGKEKEQTASTEQTKLTASAESQKAEETKTAELKEQEKKTAVEAEKKEAELKTKETAMKEAERKSAAEAAKQAKETEQKATPAKAKIILKTSNETIKQILTDIGFWETAADDNRDMAVTDCNLIDLDGKPHKLSSYKGKNILLFEWVTWSPACTTQFQFLKELRDRVSEEQLTILGVAIQTEKDDLSKVKEYVQKEKINFPVFYEPQSKLSSEFQFNLFVPCSFFIRPDGTLKVAVMEIITVRDLVRVLQAK